MEALLSYVETYLEENNGQTFQSRGFPFRVRSEHIRRVYRWAQRLLDSLDVPVNKDAVLIAAIFHDIGYANLPEHVSHATNSARLFREFASNQHYDADTVELISELIEKHSNKELLAAKETPMELVILMEADLLDETGAMSILWDCMMEGNEKEQSFQNTYDHIKSYSGQILEDHPMVTQKGKMFWQKKQELVREFIEQLAMDLFIS